jgi:hypothetical protein
MEPVKEKYGMTLAKNPIVYFPIESIHRELNARLLKAI